MSSTLLRIAAVTALVGGLAGSAAAAGCHDYSDCLQPAGPNTEQELTEFGGCYTRACARADGSTCTLPNPPPHPLPAPDPACACVYDVMPPDSACTGEPCGVCMADGSCASDCPPTPDNCPGVSGGDQDDLDGDGMGDVCDPNDLSHVGMTLKSFSISASTRLKPANTPRPNGKVRIKGSFDDPQWGPPPSQIVVVIAAAHPTHPFDQRWLLPCKTAGYTTCELRGATTSQPWIRAKLKIKYRYGRTVVDYDVDARYLTLATAPTLAAVPNVGPEKYLPSFAIVSRASSAFPITSYLTAPSPATGIDRIVEKIGYQNPRCSTRLLRDGGGAISRFSC
jgi:hypothetical protein